MSVVNNFFCFPFACNVPSELKRVVMKKKVPFQKVECTGSYPTMGEEATLGWGGGGGDREHFTLLCGFTCYRIEAIVDI